MSEIILERLKNASQDLIAVSHTLISDGTRLSEQDIELCELTINTLKTLIILLSE